MLHCRPTQDSRVLRDLLHRLLAGEPPVAVLEAMLDLLYHRSDWAHPVVWFEGDDGSAEVVGDVVDPMLAGLDAPPDSPWVLVRDPNVADLVRKVEELPDLVAERARTAGFAECWVVPVRVGDELVAIVTMWAAEGGPSVRLDPYSVGLLAQLVELVWQWWRQSLERERAATRDPLTGLPNRRALDGLQASIAAGVVESGARGAPRAGGGAEIGVLYIDLDRFKPVNDSLRHAAGDQVLRTVSTRLLSCVRPTDIVARLGGDEFGVVLPGCTTGELQAVADRVLERLADPIEVRGANVHIGSSIGAAFGVVGDTGGGSASPVQSTVEGLLERADAALYRAKHAGRGTIEWAVTETHTSVGR